MFFSCSTADWSAIYTSLFQSATAALPANLLYGPLEENLCACESDRRETERQQDTGIISH